jgi:hypothetical protein
MNDKRRVFFHMDEIEAHLSLFASDERYTFVDIIPRIWGLGTHYGVL